MRKVRGSETDPLSTVTIETMNVSVASLSPSLRIGMLSEMRSAPAGMVTVPEAARKSSPGVAPSVLMLY